MTADEDTIEAAPEEPTNPDVLAAWARDPVAAVPVLEGQAAVAERLRSLWVETPSNLVGKLARYTGSKDTPKGQREKRTCDVCGAYHEFPCVHLDYLGHADTTMLIAAADPFWTWEPRAGWDEWGEPRFIRNRDGYPIRLWIDLTILGITRPGVGTVGLRKDDPEKELIGDALRNAAMRFGIGADLWSKARGAASLDADPGDDEGSDDTSRYARHAEQSGPTPKQLRTQHFESAWEEEGLISGIPGKDAWTAAREAFAARGAALEPEARERYKAAKEAAGIPWPPTPAELRRLERMLDEAVAYVPEPCPDCGAVPPAEHERDCATRVPPTDAGAAAVEPVSDPAPEEEPEAPAGPEIEQEAAAEGEEPDTLPIAEGDPPELPEEPECIAEEAPGVKCTNAAQFGSSYCSDHEPF